MKRRLLALALMLCAVSCTDDGVTGTSTLRGTYTLRTVNGAAPLVTLSTTGTTTVELLSDQLSLFSGGTFERQARMRTTTNGQASTATTIETGNWTPLFGTSISFRTNETQNTAVATFSDRSLTFIDVGRTFIFTK